MPCTRTAQGEPSRGRSQPSGGSGSRRTAACGSGGRPGSGGGADGRPFAATFAGALVAVQRDLALLGLGRAGPSSSLAAFVVQPEMGDMPYGFWVIAALVLLGELTPVMTAGRYDPQGTVTSTAFVLAMLYLWGFWPAVLLQAGACVVSETVKRKDAWKLFFNVGQYAISPRRSLGCHVACSVFRTASAHGMSAAIPLQANDLVVDRPDLGRLVLREQHAGRRRQRRRGRSPSGRPGPRTSATTSSPTPRSWRSRPLVVLAAQASPWFIPLLLIPLYAVRKMGQISLAEEHQATHDSLDRPARTASSCSRRWMTPSPLRARLRAVRAVHPRPRPVQGGQRHPGPPDR